MDEMSSIDESDAKYMPTDILEDICDGIKYHPRINRIDARYKIHNCIEQEQAEWKVSLLSTRNMGKGSYQVFKAVANEISESLPIVG